MTSHEIASADALLTANAELRAALDYANGLARMERARREEAEAKVEGLNLAADQYSESRDQWMLKAKAAEADARAVRAEILERAEKDAEDTHRLQSYCTALLTELEAARRLKDWTRKWQRDHIISREMIAAMDTMDAAVKARETSE